MYTHIPSYSSLPPSTLPHPSKSPWGNRLCLLPTSYPSYTCEKVQPLAALSCLALCDPMDCSPPGSACFQLAIQSYTCEKVQPLAALLCLALCDPMDCSPPGYSAQGILLARILEWVAIPSVGDLCNPGLLQCKQLLYPLSHQGSPYFTHGLCVYVSDTQLTATSPSPSVSPCQFSTSA